MCKVCCFSSLFLWSENFATMVTWRHTSSLYYITAQWRVGACSFSTTWISELIPFLVFCQPIKRKTFIDLKPVNPVKPPRNSTLTFLIRFSPFYSWKRQKAMTSYALRYSSNRSIRRQKRIIRSLLYFSTWRTARPIKFDVTYYAPVFSLKLTHSDELK